MPGITAAVAAVVGAGVAYKSYDDAKDARKKAERETAAAESEAKKTKEDSIKTAEERRRALVIRSATSGRSSTFSDSLG